MEASFNHFEMNYYEMHCFIPVVSSRLQNMESNLTFQEIHWRHRSWFCTQISFHLTNGMAVFSSLLPSTASLKSAVFWGISQVKNFLLLFLLSTEGRAMLFRYMFRIALFPASAQGRWCCHQAKWLMENGLSQPIWTYFEGGEGVFSNIPIPLTHKPTLFHNGSTSYQEGLYTQSL